MSLTKATYSMIVGAPINVMDYGATGNGSTDDTAAIQAAINTGAKSIYFPQGTYLISSTLSITGSQQNFFGDGGFKSSPIIKAVTNTFPIITASGPTVNTAQDSLTFKNLTLQGGTYGFLSNVAYSGTTVANFAPGILSRTTFDTVQFNQQTIAGIYSPVTQKMIIGLMINCIFEYCTAGIISLGGNFSIWDIQSTKFEGLTNCALQIWNNTTYPVSPGDNQSAGGAITVNNCRFEAFSGSGYIPCDFRSTQNMNFTNNYFENVPTPIAQFYGSNVYSTCDSFSNNFIGIAGASGPIVNVGDATLNLVISNNYFSGGNINCIAPSGTIQKVSITNNQGIAYGQITNFALGQITNCDVKLSWIPAIQPNGTGTAWTTSSVSGSYSVVNGVVTLSGYITYTAKTSPGSYAYLTSPPIPNGQTQWLSGVSILGDTNTYTLQINATNGYGGFYKNNSPGASGYLLGSELGPSTGTISINVTYSLN